jgi:cytochrome c biogenesis protein CcdA
VVLDLILAYAAGLLTLLNPCVLPLLPLIAAGSITRHPLGPLAMAAGLAVSFTLAGIFIFQLTRIIGLAQEDVTMLAGWTMVGFGLVQLVPQAQAGFSRMAGAAASGGTLLMGRVEGRGLGGEVLAGALLGLAWSPCIGPTLGGAIGLAAQGENLLFAFAIMAMFSLGAATIMLGLTYGTRSLIASRRQALNWLMPHAKTVLGVGLIVVGLGIIFHLDRLLEAWALSTLPGWFTDLSVSI